MQTFAAPWHPSPLVCNSLQPVNPPPPFRANIIYEQPLSQHQEFIASYLGIPIAEPLDRMVLWVSLGTPSWECETTLAGSKKDYWQLQILFRLSQGHHPKWNIRIRLVAILVFQEAKGAAVEDLVGRTRSRMGWQRTPSWTTEDGRHHFTSPLEIRVKYARQNLAKKLKQKKWWNNQQYGLVRSNFLKHKSFIPAQTKAEYFLGETVFLLIAHLSIWRVRLWNYITHSMST